MNDNCLSSNPLVRDGTSQPQRLLRALLPSYVAVDERSMKDLLQFAAAYGKEIKFFDLDSNDNFDWEAFYQITDNWEQFPLEEFLANLKKYQETKPHLALFLGFLYMFQVVQADLNTITQRHLDFYYRDILHLKERPPVADQVIIIFQLAKHTHQHLVKAGTLLKAGKDDTGVERFYQVEEDVVINQAQVAELRAFYANLNNVLPDGNNPLDFVDHRLYISPIANSADGQGAKIEQEEKSWETFGRPVISGPMGQSDRQEAEIGFAIASPILFLEEGVRIITLELEFEKAFKSKYNGSPIFKSSDFRVQLSGEKEWIEPESASLNLGLNSQGDKKVLIFTLEYFPEQPPIVAYNQETLGDPMSTSWPIVKITLNPDSALQPFLFSHFKDRKINNIAINVDVKGVRNLVIQNDQGILDPAKPFLPFGSRPYVGSHFYIGSWEVFQKPIHKLDIQFQWNDLPTDENGFDGYYSVGNNELVGNGNQIPNPNWPYLRSNTSFKIDVQLLQHKAWVSLLQLQNLFTDYTGTKIQDNTLLPHPDSLSKIKILDSNPGTTAVEANPALPVLEKYDQNAQDGFLRMTLKGKDFGHAVFPRIYAKEAIRVATSNSGELPNDPYLPGLKNLSLSYNSQAEVSFPYANHGPEQFFQIHPFGTSKVDDPENLAPFLPFINQEGHLYIGISGLIPPQTLSLMIIVAEGSANPDQEKTTVNWSYLSGNNWNELTNKEILHDSTGGLLNTGIIRLDIPEKATSNHTRMPAGLHWIRASVEKNSDAVCRLIDIRTQAVFARFQDQGNDPDHLRQSLPAETIGKLVISDAAIEKVLQPYSSFGGKVMEASADFYTRTSERLRHKNRAITIWDYERLILNRYSSVYKVKCVNHTGFVGTNKSYSELAPGHVTLIIVSNVQNKNAIDPLRPKTSVATLEEIDQFIRTINPPCINIHVRNPVYEEIQVEFKVKLHSGVDAGYFQQKLETEIRSFLSPWASDCISDIRFGGSIHKSMVLNFVEERSYVDYVSCFKMYHIIEGTSSSDLEEAKASSAITILGSADNHIIDVIATSTEGCDCDDNIVKTTANPSIEDCGCGSKPKN